jgi:hypothetical protein
MMSGAMNVSRKIRDRYERLIRSESATSAGVPYSPRSSIRCQRHARATALTSARSIFGSGARSSQTRRRHDDLPPAVLGSSGVPSKHQIF